MHIRTEVQYRTSGSGSSTKEHLDPRHVGSVWTGPTDRSNALWWRIARCGRSLVDAREANHQKIRIRQSLRPGSQFERQLPTAWRNSRAQAPTGINVVEPLETGLSEEDTPFLSKEDPEDVALKGEAGEDALRRRRSSLYQA